MKTTLISAALMLCFLLVNLTDVAAQPTTPPPEIYCKHFLYGYPLGTPATNDLIIRDLYALSSNDQTKLADWVCYYLTPHETMGTLDLDRKWRADPWLDEAETLEPTPRSTDDYRGVGTGDSDDPNSSRYDRGHQIPLASVKGSRFASQVNYYSNITPQRPNLNQGPWKELEGKVRDLVEKYQQVWVMTGPLYERPMPTLPNADETHTVPSGYWKIIGIQDSGTLRVAGFIMDQQTDRGSPVIDYLVTIDEIENRSNLEFFWKLATTQQAQLESATHETWVREWLN